MATEDTLDTIQRFHSNSAGNHWGAWSVVRRRNRETEEIGGGTPKQQRRYRKGRSMRKVGQSKDQHRILIKATSLGLKQSSSRGTKRRRDTDGRTATGRQPPLPPPTPSAPLVIPTRWSLSSPARMVATCQYNRQHNPHKPQFLPLRLRQRHRRTLIFHSTCPSTATTTTSHFTPISTSTASTTVIYPTIHIPDADYGSCNLASHLNEHHSASRRAEYHQSLLSPDKPFCASIRIQANVPATRAHWGGRGSSVHVPEQRTARILAIALQRAKGVSPG
ncbi:hypothetical protein EDC04DRAFT_351210 [Pisolithus marmoratus]|nr:hypothetical protein EDC04DRAFT_351210 [Pisolithus marmoratus]